MKKDITSVVSIILFVCGIVFFMFIDQARTQKTISNPIQINNSTSRLTSWYNWNNKNKLFLKEYINLEDDNSLYKYVNKDKPLNDKTYTPLMLVDVSSEYVIQRNRWMQLRPEANAALDDLAQAFYDTFWKNLYLVSAYRSYTLQKELLADGCSRNRCAQAGTSEHQLGLAIDIHVWENGKQSVSMSNKNTPYYKRLEQNAHKFWRHNTFQKWVAIDGQMEEWRHWRYVGRSLARKLWEENLTLGEYYKLQTKE